MAHIVKVEVDSQLQWRATQSAASGRWIGVCDALSLVMEADSLDELYSVIHEAVQLLMTDLLEDDELTQYFRARGWRAANMPSRSDIRDVQFLVPWQLIAEGADGSKRVAH